MHVARSSSSVEAVPRLLRLHETAQEIRPGAAAALLDETAEVVRHLAGRAAPALDHVGSHGQHDGVERTRHVARPCLHRLAVVDGNAQELGDHRHGQGVGQVLDHVHPAGPGDALEEAVHDPLDVRAQRLDDAWREGLADERAEPRVIRRVAEEHGQREPGPVRRGAEPALDEGLVPALAEARVAEQGGDVVVPGQHVEPQPMAVDGVLGPEPMEGGVRVREELGVEEVQLGHARRPARRV